MSALSETLLEQWNPVINFLKAVSSATARWAWQHQLWRTPWATKLKAAWQYRNEGTWLASSACWSPCSATRFGLCLCPLVVCYRQCSLLFQGKTLTWVGGFLSWARLPGRAGRMGFRYKPFLGGQTSHKHQHLEHLQVATMAPGTPQTPAVPKAL